MLESLRSLLGSGDDAWARAQNAEEAAEEAGRGSRGSACPRTPIDRRGCAAAPSRPRGCSNSWCGCLALWHSHKRWTQLRWPRSCHREPELSQGCTRGSCSLSAGPPGLWHPQATMGHPTSVPRAAVQARTTMSLGWDKLR